MCYPFVEAQSACYLLSGCPWKSKTISLSTSTGKNKLKKKIVASSAFFGSDP